MKARSVAGLAVMAALVVFSGSAQAQNAANGEKAFKKICYTCHYTPENDKNWSGPSLYGIINRHAGTYNFAGYSRALTQSNIVWGDETLDAFIKNPESAVPGTKMHLIGVSAPDVRADIIAYLKVASPSH